MQLHISTNLHSSPVTDAAVCMSMLPNSGTRQQIVPLCKWTTSKIHGEAELVAPVKLYFIHSLQTNVAQLNEEIGA
jgi:hypothetical protein